MSGVVLQREFINHKYYQDIKFRLVYFHLLLRGGKVVSLNEIADATDLRKSEVRKIIDLMREDGEIIRHSHSRSKKYYEVKNVKAIGEEKAINGTRIDERLRLTQEWINAAKKIGVDNPSLVFDEFKDYWLARAGKAAYRVNWLVTWRGWCIKSLKYRKQNKLEDDIPEEFRGLKPSEILKKRGLWDGC
jgi:biotin operon repressor